MDKYQIIKEKVRTIIPKEQPFSHKDFSPRVSVTQDMEGNTILKEIWFQVIDLQQSAGEEDAGSNAEDCGPSTR
ncbi:MAG: hypothetical protein GY861_19940 [bacterium]|nr:hypothetical protein [bacterium]